MVLQFLIFNQGALGASVVALGLIANSGSSGKDVKEKPIVKEDKKESKPVAVKKEEVLVETVKTKATPVPEKKEVAAEAEVVTKKAPEPVVEIPKKKEVEVIETKKEEPTVEVLSPTSSSASGVAEAALELPPVDINIDLSSITSSPLLVTPFAFLALRATLQNSKSIREREQMNEKTKEFYKNVDEKVKRVKEISEEVDRDLKDFKDDMD